MKSHYLGHNGSYHEELRCSLLSGTAEAGACRQESHQAVTAAPGSRAAST